MGIDAAQDKLTQADIDIALLKQSVEHRDEQLRDLYALVKSLTEKVDIIQATLTEAKGGWKMLMLFGGAAGVAVSAVQWAINHLSLRG